jgi:peroxiredoxin Q/BCP
MRDLRRTLCGVLLGATAALVLARPALAIEVGQRAPDFTLTAPGNKQVKLADLLGKGPVVLYTFVDAFSAA